MAQSPTPVSPQGDTDPSMDDILASIRRILSDEEKAAKSAAPSDDVLKLEPSMMVDDEQGASMHPDADAQSQTHAPLSEMHGEAEHPAHPEAPAHGTQFGTPHPFGATQVFPPEHPEPPRAPEPSQPPAAAAIVGHVDAGSGGNMSPEPGHEALIAPEAAAQAASSVGTLMRTLMSERHAAVHRGGPTIEDMVREEIRPLLKGWLDRHLPDLVERLVRTEIERVVGRITG